MDVLKGFNPNALYDTATDTEGNYDLGSKNESYMVVGSSEDDSLPSKRVTVMQPTYDLGRESDRRTNKQSSISNNQTYDLATPSTENNYDLASNTNRKQPIYDLGRNSNQRTLTSKPNDPDAALGFYADTSGRAPGEYDVLPLKNKSRAPEETNYAFASDSNENNYDLASNTNANGKQPIYDVGKNSNRRTLTSNPDDPDAALGFYADTSGRAPGEYELLPVKNQPRVPEETNYAFASDSNENNYDLASINNSSSSKLRSGPDLPNRNLPPLDRTAHKTVLLAQNTFVCDCCCKPFDPSFSPAVKSSSNPVYQGEDPAYDDANNKSCGYPTLTADSIQNFNMKDNEPPKYATLTEYDTLQESNVDDLLTKGSNPLYDAASPEGFGFNPYDLGEDSGRGDSSSDEGSSQSTDSNSEKNSSKNPSPSKLSNSYTAQSDYTLVLPGLYDEPKPKSSSSEYEKPQPAYMVPVKGPSILETPDDYELPAAHINTPELWAKKALERLPSHHPLRPLLLSYLSNPNFFNASLVTRLVPQDIKHNSLKNRAILISFCGDARHEECATESSGCTKQACQSITNVMKTVLRLESKEEPFLVKVTHSRSWKHIAKRIGQTVCGLGIATAIVAPVTLHFIGGGGGSSSSPPSNATSSASSSDCTGPEFENPYQNVSIAAQTLGALALPPLADIACSIAAVAQAVFTGAAVLGLACRTKIQNNIQPLTSLPFNSGNIQEIADALENAASSPDCSAEVIAALAASEHPPSSQQGPGTPPNFSAPPPAVEASNSQSSASASSVSSADSVAPSSSDLPLPSAVAFSSDSPSLSASNSQFSQSSLPVPSSDSVAPSSSNFSASSSIASSSQSSALSSELPTPSPVSSSVSPSASQVSSSPLSSSASVSRSSTLPSPSPVNSSVGSSASQVSSLQFSQSASVFPSSSASASSLKASSSPLSSSASASVSSALPTPSPVSSSASASSSKASSSPLSSSASASASSSLSQATPVVSSSASASSNLLSQSSGVSSASILSSQSSVAQSSSLRASSSLLSSQSSAILSSSALPQPSASLSSQPVASQTPQASLALTSTSSTTSSSTLTSTSSPNTAKTTKPHT